MTSEEEERELNRLWLDIKGRLNKRTTKEQPHPTAQLVVFACVCESTPLTKDDIESWIIDNFKYYKDYAVDGFKQNRTLVTHPPLEDFDRVVNRFDVPICTLGSDRYFVTAKAARVFLAEFLQAPQKVSATNPNTNVRAALPTTATDISNKRTTAKDENGQVTKQQRLTTHTDPADAQREAKTKALKKELEELKAEAVVLTQHRDAVQALADAYNRFDTNTKKAFEAIGWNRKDVIGLVQTMRQLMSTSGNNQ